MDTPELYTNHPLRAVAPMNRRFCLRCLLFLFLLAVTLYAYWPATNHDFVNYDDQLYVTSNAQVQSGLNLESISWAFLHPVVGNWHPLTMLSHMLDCEIFGLKPWGHHLTSILLHGINTALVFLFLCRLTGATWRSLMVAALFGLHPLHVESVAWVAERKDVLSTFFGLLCLIAYADYARASELKNRKAEIGKQTSLYYSLAWLFFALGLMSKAMLVTVPFIFLLLDFWPLNRWQPTRLRWLFIEKIPFFLLAAIIGVVTYIVQKNDGMMRSMANLPFGDRLGNALISYVRYLGKFFWPENLCVYYPHPGHWPVVAVLAAFFCLVFVTWLVHRLRKACLTVGWLWYLGTLLPVIGLVQVGGQSLADRYVYIPSLGLLIMVVWGAYGLARPWRHHAVALSLAGCAAIILCFTLTRQQLGYWHDNEALYHHALAVTENNYLAHHNLGTALYQNGQIDEAINQYRAAILVEPDNAAAHYDLGTALALKGQTIEAISELQESIRLKPDDAESHKNLGTAFGRAGQMDEAISQYREAVKLKPNDAGFRYDLGTALGMNGQIDEAIVQFQEAIQLKPDFVQAKHNLAHALQIKNASMMNR